MSKRTFSFRSALASWCEFSFKRLKPRGHQTRLLLERLEDRTVLANFMPTMFDDGPLGSGSLRDTILQANADPGSATITITLKPGTYTLSIPNTNGQENDGNLGDLDINTSANVLIIQGGGVPGSNAGPTIIDADNVDRAFQIFHNLNNTAVFFKNLTIVGGLAQDDGIDGRLPGTSDALGGAILSNDSTVILDHVIIRNNEALGGDGADGLNAPGGDGFAARGGGVYLENGAVTLTNSDIRRNKAIGGNGGAGGTIGIQNPDNIAPHGGDGTGAVGGGLFALRADVTLTTSIVAANSAIGGAGGEGGNGNILDIGIGGDGGDGGVGFGGGLYAAGGTVAIMSSTISKNVDKGGRGGEGGIGKSGGNGGQGGNAFGGGFFANDSDALTLTDTDLLGNFAQGGEAGGGHSGTASVPSGPDPNSGLLGQGGNGGVGGAAWGGGLYAISAQGPIIVDGGQVNGNTANGGHGGNAGHGADDSNIDSGGFGGTGGMGGFAQGGGIFTGPGQVDITSTEVSENSAKGGFGGAGGHGGDNDDAGNGGAGGEGGGSRGGGILFNLAPDTPVNLTSSPVLSNHALGGGGGKGGSGGTGDDEDGGDGGAGGTGGIAQGGGIFLGHNLDVGGNLTLTSLPLSSNEAIGGDGGRGANGGLGESAGHGGAGGAGGAGQGGGLFADGSSVTIATSTISSNKAQGGSGDNGGRAGKATDEDGAAGGDGGTGGAGQGGGLFATSAIITVTQSTIDNNEATGAEGGKGGRGGKSSDDGGDAGNGGTGGAGQGAGLYSLGSSATLNNSTVSTNTARGGKGGDGGMGGEGGDDDSDVSGNGGDGGNGGAVQGGGIYLSGESLTLRSDTITKNKVRPSTGGKPGQAGPGFGVGFSGSPGSGQPGVGGGIFNLDALVNSFNTLIAENTADSAPDFAGLFNIALFNLLGNNDGSNLAFAFPVPDSDGNIVGSNASPIDPKLGSLANNGGPTKTHALLVNSPAINKGDNGSSPGSTDQRGAGFDRIVGGTIDIGAFEFQGRPGTKSTRTNPGRAATNLRSVPRGDAER